MSSSREARYGTWWLAGIVPVALLAVGPAFGSGFALQELSGSGMGNAYAGGAAVAGDASTIYTNPAGMVRLPSVQMAAATSLICPSMKFLDARSESAALQPAGGDGGNAASCAAVPALYLSTPIDERWWFGIGVNAPFGLTTEYDASWRGRFQAIESEVETVNLNPSLAFRLNERIAIGFGINWQYINAKFTNRVNYTGAIIQAVEQGVAAGNIPTEAVPALFASALGLEADARVKGHDSAWGWNAGVLFWLTPETRIGLQYRSRIDYRLQGNSNFSTPPLAPLPPSIQPAGDAVVAAVNGGLLANGPVSVALDVPQSANLSVYHDLGSRWHLMADVQYTGWDNVQHLEIDRGNGSILINTPEDFRDTWRYSLGASLDLNDRWTLRGGLAFDQSPVRDTERTPRLPDNDRKWITMGARYHYSPQLSFDMAYAHIYMSTTHIDQDAGDVEANGRITGGYHNYVNMLAVQANYRFR